MARLYQPPQFLTAPETRQCWECGVVIPPRTVHLTWPGSRKCHCGACAQWILPDLARTTEIARRQNQW